MSISAFSSYGDRRKLNITYYGKEIVEMIERNDFAGILEIDFFGSGFTHPVSTGLIEADFIYNNMDLLDDQTLRVWMIRSYDECAVRGQFEYLRDRDRRLFLDQQEMIWQMNRIREDLYFEYIYRTEGEEKPERIWPILPKTEDIFNNKEIGQLSLF